MKNLFAFKKSIISAEIGDIVEIYSKYNYDSRVTVQIESDNHKYDGIYAIEKDKPFLSFNFEEPVHLNAIRIWGGVWDFDAPLECVINTHINPENDIISNVNNKDIQKRRYIPNYTYYGFNRSMLHKVRNTSDKYQIAINSPIDVQYEIETSDNVKLLSPKYVEIIGENNEKDVLWNYDELNKLGVILGLKINGSTFEIPGVIIDSEDDLEECAKELNWSFENANYDYKVEKIDNGIIFPIIEKVGSITLIGATGNSIKTFIEYQKKEQVVEIQHLANGIWKKDNINIKLHANKEIKNSELEIVILNNNDLKVDIDAYNIEGDLYSINAIFNDRSIVGTSWTCYTKDDVEIKQPTKILKNDSLVWYIQVPKHYNKREFKIQLFGIGRKIEHTILIKKQKKIIKSKLFYNLKVDNKKALIKLSPNDLENQKFEFKVENGHSKEGIDFEVGKFSPILVNTVKEKIITIHWLNSNPIKNLTAKINGLEIPINWIDKNYYPTTLSFLSDKHMMNKGCSKKLKLKYYNPNSEYGGEITIQPNQTTFDFKPIKNFLLWECYDDNNLLWKQDIVYKNKLRFLTIDTPSKISKDGLLEIKFKLNKSFSHDTTFNIDSVTNSGIKMNNKYKFKSGENNFSIKLKPKTKKKISWLVFRITDASHNIRFDSSKKIVMFD
jgi:hypothetical protein